MALKIWRVMGMKILKAVDNYFIGKDEGTTSCRVYFYGQYAIYLSVTLFTIISIH